MPFKPLSDSLFLFDIDGTLLATGSPHHGPALLEAIREVCHVEPDRQGLVLAGRTDAEILLELMGRAGVEGPNERLGEVIERSIANFQSHLPLDFRHLVLPGVRETLQRLVSAGGRLGLVTGNISDIAWDKMRAAGLADYFDFGAFGEESAFRADLPPLAMQRAGGRFLEEQTYVIGDTPRDIDCGRACAMRTVAVATGRYSLPELQACSPSFACSNLLEFTDSLLPG